MVATKRFKGSATSDFLVPAPAAVELEQLRRVDDLHWAGWPVPRQRQRSSHTVLDLSRKKLTDHPTGVKPEVLPVAADDEASKVVGYTLEHNVRWFEVHVSPAWTHSGSRRLTKLVWAMPLPMSDKLKSARDLDIIPGDSSSG